MELSEFRALFPVTRTRAYLFSGALAPAAAPVRAAWDGWTDRWSSDPNAVYTGDGLIGAADRLRESFAALIGADPSTIAITDNTCRAANIAIRILAERPAGNVVVDDGTYPSSAYPWYARGDREVRYVPTDGVEDAAGALAGRIDDDTVAVCITHVAPFTGRRHDLRAIADAAHARGARVVVDAAQSTGVVPIDVGRDGVDVLVTTAMKWLLGPPGIGFLHLHPELLAQAPVLDVGYLGLDAPLGDWPPHTMPPVVADARRYELGLPNLPGVFAARAGIELLREVGIERVFARVEQLAGRLMDGLAERGADLLTPADPAQRAGVIAFRHPDPQGLFDLCRSRGVDIGAIGAVRVDPHAFNDEDDIDRFLACCDAFTPAPAEHAFRE
ncbi:MAG TPA: aminotransferase class V-fold PLP-dependent enzyme [Gaiellales bacterium]|nr:aminotransferase class V-fold PLP-dependent enzyme [Gaiellales bacterium]